MGTAAVIHHQGLADAIAKHGAYCTWSKPCRRCGENEKRPHMWIIKNIEGGSENVNLCSDCVAAYFSGVWRHLPMEIPASYAAYLEKIADYNRIIEEGS